MNNGKNVEDIVAYFKALDGFGGPMKYLTGQPVHEPRIETGTE